jgi:hypothetical protein
MRKMERIIRAVAGSFVTISLILGYFISPYWYLFTLFVGLNLFQSAFTKWCLAEEILKKFGIGVRCSSEGSMNSEFEPKKQKV